MQIIFVCWFSILKHFLNWFLRSHCVLAASFSVVTPYGMWNLSSLTRGWTHTLCSGSVETTTEPPRKSNSEDGFQSRPGHSHGQSLDLPNDMGQLLSFFLKWVWIELIHLDSCTFPVRPEITECPSSDAALQYGVECSGPSVSGVPLESTATW